MAMLVDNPLLTVLGRRGRGALIEALRRAPNRTWSVRDLATFADVDAMTSSRAVKELAALGAVTVVRPGRDARIRWSPASAAARFLAGVDPPDLRLLAGRVFASSCPKEAVLRIVAWHAPADDPASPSVPPRLAIVSTDVEAAIESAGAALDAVRAAGLPMPEVAAFERAELQPGDATADAILRGVTMWSRATGTA